jgi:DNA (cytosine-5)-methyltransferase 1
MGFVLENVEGLVTHEQGKTLKTIIEKLEDIGYKVSWKVLDSSHFGLPQSRKRVYIVGTTNTIIDLEFSKDTSVNLSNILEQGKETLDTPFTKAILKHFSTHFLLGKSIKDKRGGVNNIHSWDIELKGRLLKEQKELLNILLKQRRRKSWAEQKGISWGDGIPLTVADIFTFYPNSNLENMLKDLVNKGYLKQEHPKDLVEVIDKQGKKVKRREYRTDIPKGYNIIVGKLSFEFNKILDTNGIAPTLVATDMDRLAVIDGQGIRKLTIRECLRLFGFPEDYKIDQPINKAYDLLGNTVAVPVLEKISEKIIKGTNHFWK